MSPEDTQELNRPVILVVEDDADLLWYVASELREHFLVETAVNGHEALSKAMETVPDLVITDLMMPIMGGIELCRELKGNEATFHIPVIMLTAKTSMESHVEGLEAGADDYVAKPFPMPLLLARINNLLENRRMLRERFSDEFSEINHAIPECSMDKAFMTRAVRIAQENLAEPEFKPDVFAAKMNMGVRSLQRKLKAVADLTPARFIIELRMKRAAELLANSRLTVTEIAFEVGCEDSSHFARMFKQHYGLTPSKYRDANARD